MKNCDRGLENAARGRRLRAAFSSPRSQFFTIRTEPKPANSLIVWVIDQVCSVKMAGYWPSSFFACLWTETKSRSINSQKKNEANIQPS